MKEQDQEQYLLLINDLHNKAMSLSDEADYLKKKKGTKEKIQALYMKAFQQERAAAMSVVYQFDLEPTRSVLFRSAASLLLSLPELTKADYEEAERMIAFGLIGKPHPEIAVELREVWQQLEQKYQQQRWKKEFFTNKSTIEETGFFTVLNSKTLTFEFQTFGGLDLKGSYPLELDKKIRMVALKNAYSIKGEICSEQQCIFLSDVLGVEVAV